MPAPYWISPILSLVVGLLTIGMTYGILKATVSHLKEEVERIRESTEKNEANFAGLREELHVALARSEGKALASRRRRAS